MQANKLYTLILAGFPIFHIRYSLNIGADRTVLRAESKEVGVASENLATDNADLGANCANPGADSSNLDLKVRSLS